MCLLTVKMLCPVLSLSAQRLPEEAHLWPLTVAQVALAQAAALSLRAIAKHLAKNYVG